MKNKVTAIMPTHNRHQYLERALDYYEKVKITFNVIVLDSSDKAFGASELCANVKYKHCPGKSFLQKINDELQNIKTPYVLLCADDDFIVQNGLLGCVDFLELNLDFIAVQGLVTRFINLDEVLHMPDEINSAGKCFNSISPKERIKQGLVDCYTQTFYSVYRTEVLQKILKEAAKINYNLFELFITTSTYTLGKYAVIPSFYYVREDVGFSEGKNITGIENFINYERDKLGDDYEKFLDTLVVFGVEHGVDKKFYTDIFLEYAILFDPKIKIKRNSTLRKLKIKIHSMLKKPLSVMRSRNQLAHYKDVSQRTIAQVKDIKEYPFFDELAEKHLEIITNVVKKHNLRSY